MSIFSEIKSIFNLDVYDNLNKKPKVERILIVIFVTIMGVGIVFCVAGLIFNF